VVLVDPDQQWQKIKAEFIADFGQYFESYGVNEIMGRIIGLLIFAPRPQSLPEITAALQLSKAAVSIHIRALRQKALVEKVLVPGDRRDYYQMDPGFGQGLFSEINQKIVAGLNLIEDALRRLEKASPGNDLDRKELTIAGERLGNLKDLYLLHQQLLAELSHRLTHQKDQ
jgi:DNA-binding transcriptional regulator GbsR (MarR family)